MLKVQNATENTYDFDMPFYGVKREIDLVLKAFKLQADMRQIKLRLKIKTGNVNVCTNWRVYRSILFHLVQNAVKFNKTGGKITIILFDETEDDEDDELQLSDSVSSNS